MHTEEAASLLAALNLGSSVAETDDLLESARVETSVFDDLLADRVDLVPGTKGSGKTALYRIFVDFLPSLLLSDRRVVVAHGVQQRQDTVFLAYKEQFDRLNEADFIDFWCIYLISLADEQFIRSKDSRALLSRCKEEIADFRRKYTSAGIPELGRKKTLKEIIGWTLAVVYHLRPRLTWKAPEDIGQFEFTFGGDPPIPPKEQGNERAAMPTHIDSLSISLENILRRANLSLWLMIDRLDELFARRSSTEQRVRRIFSSARLRQKFSVDDRLLASNVEYQRRLFYKIFPNTVHNPPNQSPTLRWIYSHTKDGRGVVTPRDVILLLTRACQWQRDALRRDPEGESEHLLSGTAIRYGLEELSKEKRTVYLQAEFPHKWAEIGKLLGGRTEYSEAAMRRLFGRKYGQVIEDLLSLGILERSMRGGAPTFKIPFLYRHGLECTQKFISA